MPAGSFYCFFFLFSLLDARHNKRGSKYNTTQPRPGQSRAGSSLPQAQENNGIYQVAGRIAAEPGRGGPSWAELGLLAIKSASQLGHGLQGIIFQRGVFLIHSGKIWSEIR